jgi:hypothetical protein
MNNVPREVLKEIRPLLLEISYDSHMQFDVSTNHLKEYACIDVDVLSSINNKLLKIISLFDAVGLDKYITEVLKNDNQTSE